MRSPRPARPADASGHPATDRPRLKARVQTGTMQTGELIRVTARTLDVPLPVAQRLVHTVLTSIADAVASGRSVTLLNVGHLHVTPPQPREGRGLFQGRVVASRASIKFIPTRALTARLRGNT
ncbi:hypothetical protein DM785_02610 [Deinococcus actinosclerus]|nr:hypothetical protein DM785_02610 [Deinococcus actinosclerus]